MTATRDGLADETKFLQGNYYLNELNYEIVNCINYTQTIQRA